MSYNLENRHESLIGLLTPVIYIVIDTLISYCF
jgi:hypothetical protein